MTTALILSIALTSQVAGPAKTPAATAPQSKATVAKPAPTKADYRATIQSTIEKKKAAKEKKTRSRTAKRLQEQAETKARRDQAERMAPALAAQQREGLRLQAETQALQQMSNAMMQNAATNQLRLRLQSQQAGVPQVFVPGQGFSPYAGGIAAPYAPPVIVIPGP